MHIRIVWQGRDYTINPSSHLQGWDWCWGGKWAMSWHCHWLPKDLRCSSTSLYSSILPQETSTNTHYAVHNYPFRPGKLSNYDSIVLLISPLSILQFTLTSFHTISMWFCILHISPSPTLRDLRTHGVPMITEVAPITVDSVYTDYSCYNCQWDHIVYSRRSSQRPPIIRLLTTLPGVRGCSHIPADKLCEQLQYHIQVSSS